MVHKLSKNSPLNYLPVLLEDGPALNNVTHILHTIRTHLRMDVAFVSEFAEGRRFFRYVNALEGLSLIQVGDSSPLEEGYCQRVVEGRLPELIPDTATVPAAMALPVTRAIPVGAHLSVPIRLSDGRLYGTFCCFSFVADPSLNERDLQMMRAFADLTAFQIDRDLQPSIAREEQYARIKTVIDQQQFSIVYQPIYELGHNRVEGLGPGVSHSFLRHAVALTRCVVLGSHRRGVGR